MKKQRNTSSKFKKSHPASSSSSTTNHTTKKDSDIIITSSSSTGSSNNGAAAGGVDEYHNLSTPCCLLAREIALEIFPDVNIFLSLQEQKEEGKNNKEGGGGESRKRVPQQQQQQQQQPLLGSIIRQHLLEQRKIQRKSNFATTTTSTGGNNNKKKKKKRQKKKKASSTTTVVVDAESSNDGAATTTTTSSGTSGNDANAKEAEANKEEKVEPKKPLPQDLLPRTTTTTNANDNKNNKASATSNQQQQQQQHHQQQEAKEEPTDLDYLLDQYLNTPTTNTNHSLSTSSPPLNRDLTSFVSFLITRYNNHYHHYHQNSTSSLPTTQQQHQQQPNTRKKKSSSSSSRISDTKNILPTISLTKIIESCENAGCRLCRTSASTYLREFTNGSVNNNNGGTNGTKFGYNNNNNGGLLSGSSSHGSGGNSRNGCIVIDESCTKIPPPPSSSANQKSTTAASSSLAVPVHSMHGPPSLDTNNSGTTNNHHHHDDDDDVEKAFDYIAMEEGNAPNLPGFSNGLNQGAGTSLSEPSSSSSSPSSSFQLTFCPMTNTTTTTTTTTSKDEKDDDAQHRFLQLTPKHTTNNNNHNNKNDENNNNNTPSSFPLTVHDIEKLAKYILLPCGMSELQNIAKKAKENILQTMLQQKEKEEELQLLLTSKEEWNKLQTQIITSQNSIQIYLTELQKLKDAISTLLSQVVAVNSSTSSSTFDTNTSTKLQECDAKCDSYLDTALELLLTVTEIMEMSSSPWSWSSSSSTSTSSSSGTTTNNKSNYRKWAIKLLADMWDLYDTALIEAIEPKLLHRGKAVALAGRGTTIPALYLNVQHRDRYRTMLDDKVNLLSDFQERLERLLLFSSFPMEEEEMVLMQEGRRGGGSGGGGGNGNGANALMGLCALASYYAHHPSSTVRCDDFNSKNELNFRKLLHERKVMASQTIRCGKKDDLFKIPRDQYETVKKLYEELSESIKEESIKVKIDRLQDDDSNDDDDDDIKNAWNDFEKKEQMLREEELQRQDACTIPDEEKPSQEDMQRMINLTSITISKWRLLLYFRYDDRERKKNGRNRHGLPLRLKKWLVLSSSSSSSSDENNSSDNNETASDEKDICKGGGGKRRVSCIVATYLYRWLHDRCMEWHADLTQRELLSAVEEDGTFLGNDDALMQHSQGTSSGSNQRGKKASKKKKKKEKAMKATTRKEESDSPEISTTNAEKVQKSLLDEIKTSKSEDRADSVTADSASEEPRVENDTGPTEAMAKEIDLGNGSKSNVTDIDIPGNSDEKDTSTSIDSEAQKECGSEVLNETDPTLVTEQQEQQEEELPAQELVGVVHGNKFQTAEEYMMQRLYNIHRLGDTDILPNKTSVPILML